VYIFDLYSIALSKITRGFESDLEDLQFLLAQNLIAWDELENHFKGVLPCARTADIGPKEFQAYFDSLFPLAETVGQYWARSGDHCPA
jgi:hypothetical protein